MQIVILGAGPGGYAAAIRAARKGAEVTLIDRGEPGGTCLHKGCIPSKIMRRTADVAREVRDAEAFGVEGGGGATVNMATLRKRQKAIVDAQAKGLAHHFKALGIALVRGSGSVANAGSVDVTGDDGAITSYPYDHLLLATGSVPMSIPGLEPDGDRILTSDEALWMEELPESLLVVGGGVIGCELAQIFHDFGVRITLVEGLERLLPLPGVDEEISKTYMRSLKKAKLPYVVGQTLAGVRKDGNGLIATIKPFGGEGEPREINCDKVLVAIGRKACADGLGLEALGVRLDKRGWIEADEYFRTNAPHVWAIGDCLGPARVMLAHAATAEGLAAVENMFGAWETVDYPAIPSAVFTAPEIGCVGLSLAQTQEADPESRAHDFLFRQLGKAQAMGETDGLFRIVSGPDGRVLGGHIIGACATSLIAELALAVARGLSVDDIAKTVHAHPTLPEGVWEAALSAAGRPLHGA